MGNTLFLFLRTLIKDRRAVASLEMVLMMPLVCVLLVGLYETYIYMRTIDLLDRGAVSLSNLVSLRNKQLKDCMSTSDGANIGTYFYVTELTVEPLILSKKGMIILSTVTNPAGTPLIAWQRITRYRVSSMKSSIGTEGGKATLPANFPVTANGNDTVVIAELFYDYDPFEAIRPLVQGLPAAGVLTRTVYFRSRYGGISQLAQCS